MEFVTLRGYFSFLLEEADAAYWLNRNPTVGEIIELWNKITGEALSPDDYRFVRIRSGYDGKLRVCSVADDKTMWVRLLLAFFTYGKKVNRFERKIYLEEAKTSWERCYQRRKSMLTR